MIIRQYKNALNDAVCDLSFKIQTGKVIVTITEIKANKGPTITSFYEALATEIYYNFLNETPTEDILWIEHYPASSLRKETFSRVHMYWDAGLFTRPRRKQLKEKTITKDKLEMEMDTLREAMACYGTSLWDSRCLVEKLERLLAILRDKGKRIKNKGGGKYVM